ncbi:tetratricopeptide repeat protein, partial [Mesorhizobium sp. M2C.T.Ca.TU.002.02.1.1]|uniref:tetratricopeptide repeat protein n=1 Tax=Mesorhizobium sp. M2C.T.Ca.TU.002.02.1.1 TaxID=2496788 RepID=UPI000FCCC226
MRRGRRLSFAACLILAVAAAPAASLAQTVDELYASAVKARQAQHFDEAADLLRRALALKPDNADALVQLGFAELGRNNLPAARDAFSRALSIAPTYRDASFGVAEVEFRSGNMDAALPLAEQVAEVDPANADAAKLVDNIRKAKRAAASKPKPAVTAQAVMKKPHRRPDPVPGLMEEGRRLRQAGRLPEAEKVYRRALR